MFCSLFGSKQESDKEIEIKQSLPYLSLTDASQQESLLKARLAEHEILQNCGLNAKVEDIEISLPKELANESKQFIHTLKYERQSQNNQTNTLPSDQSVLLVHGFGGTGLNYFRMLGEFKDRYNAYSIDLLGMGQSSRSKFELTNIDDIILYFVESIEQWRIAKNIQKLILVGHSFGGYMSMHYALKYSQRVSSLFLISPMGGTTRTQAQVDEWAARNKGGFWSSILINYAKSVWREKKTISQFLKMPLVPSTYLIKGFIKKRLKIEESLQNLWYQYQSSLFELPESSEKSVFYLLRFPRMSAIHSIEHSLRQLKENNLSLPFHIHFIYGDQDWMCSEGAHRIVDQALTPSSLLIIQQASHQIILDQPKILAKYILENTK